LAILEEDPEKKTKKNHFMISAIFYRKAKPPVHEFLASFIIKEYNELEKNGLKFMGKNICH
jgi:hypothetical protein